MTLIDELTTAVLDEDETLLGYLDPSMLEVEETNKLGGLRTLTITHPLIDSQGTLQNGIADLLVHGNKIWRPLTCDGDSCLYVIIDDREINPEKNTITVECEEAAAELSQLPPVRVSTFTEYFDDFEDGEYTSRDDPYLDWVLGSGRVAIESTTPISGVYSIKHTGSGSDSINNAVYTYTGWNNITTFTFKLTTTGTNARSPLVWLWFTRYHTTDRMVIWTNYNGGKQYLTLSKYEGSTWTDIQSVEWLSSKLTTTYSHDFIIEDIGSHITVTVDGTVYIDTDYTTNQGVSNVGFGCNHNTAGLWDNISTQGFTGIPTITIDEDYINELCGALFTASTITTGQEYTYTGTKGIMGLLREIETQTGYEFQFRYLWNSSTKRIDRFIDYLPSRGVTHTTPIEIGYNTGNITLTENEGDLRVAAAPLGEPSDDKTETLTSFHLSRRLWENLEVSTSSTIPLWVTKDEEGLLSYGPYVRPPYPKTAGSLYVSSESTTESVGNYQVITEKKGLSGTHPRTVLFESSEKNPYNLYWLCVKKIRENQQPSFELDSSVVDINKLTTLTPTYYNVGDTVTLWLPGRSVQVSSRVVETQKDPRDMKGDKVELGNYRIDFFNDYLRAGRPGGTPYTEL